MHKVQPAEEQVVHDDYNTQVEIVEDVTRGASYLGHNIDNAQSLFRSMSSPINTDGRTLNQFEAEIIEFPRYDLRPVTVFERHDAFCDVRVYRDRGCLCAKIKVRDNFIIQDLLNEISPDIERLTIKGWDAQYIPFETIALDFSGFENLVALNCNEVSNLSGFIDLPESLLELDCSYTSIEELNDLPSELRVLTCSYTNITKLDYLPNNLQSLNCSYNYIESLDRLPHGLQMLDCSCNKLRELCNLPASLRHLNCQDNRIILIDNIPENLSLMDVSSNPIIHLRNLPKSLTFFYCKDCVKLAHIGKFPSGLQTLWCEGTDLKHLDLLQCKYLQRFICDRELLRHVIFDDRSNFTYHYYNFNDRAVSMAFRNSGRKTNEKLFEYHGN